MRTTWNGSISFGLVNIPVGLAPATAPAARQSDVSFRMLHRECMTPIQQKRWCPVHDVEVGPDEIVRGWEVAKGQFVPIEDAELEAIEQRDTSHTIDVSRFVKADEVDPIYFDRTYYLVPAGTEAQRRPYALLLQAMREQGVIGIGSFVLAGKEKLAAVRPKGDALALETLFVAEDVKSQDEIDEAIGATAVRRKSLKLAEQLISGLLGLSTPTRAEERLPASLRELLEAKVEGREIAEPAPAEPETPVIDLMEALRASVAASAAGKKGSGAKDASTRSPPPPRSARQRAASSSTSAAPAPSASPGAREVPPAAPGRGTCRSSPGRSGRALRRRCGSLRRVRSRLPSTALPASDGWPCGSSRSVHEKARRARSAAGSVFRSIRQGRQLTHLALSGSAHRTVKDSRSA